MKTTCASSTRSNTDSRPVGTTAAVLTTGCRLNQSESDALRRKLCEQGIAVVEAADGADVCYVNTCTVTAEADRSSMQLIRRVTRLQPKPRLVAMGCLAERAPDRLRTLAGVDDVWDNARKQSEIAGVCPATGRSRALLKIQDGCARRCSYCVVAGLRGEPRSVPAAAVLDHLRRLLDDGFHEVVLTGLNLGAYADESGTDLAGLLALLSRCEGRFRVRLGSIEPDTVGERLVEAIASPLICPHFHLPLQSGDDGVLQAMGRGCTSRQYARVVRQLLSARPDACIGADVIAGYPGETSDSFERTRRFVAELPLGYLHAFSYSPRPGTTAARQAEPNDRSVSRARVRTLRIDSDAMRRTYEQRFVGTVRGAVVETARSALTDNYIRLQIDGAHRLRPGELADFRIEQADTGMAGVPAGRCRGSTADDIARQQEDS